MASGETPLESLADGAFPQTRWSLLLEETRDPEQQKERWESLASTYWKPVYGYVRTRWARTSEDALDATQEFFLWMLESGFVKRADPNRGAFRGFLKSSLANFLIDLERKHKALKRGGARTFLPIQGDEDSVLPDLADSARLAPEQVLDDLWRAEILERAVAALASELANSGKATYFAVFRDYFLDDEKLDYQTVATRHGITTVDVSNYLAHAKRRYRVQLERAVLETVGNRSELEEELNWLLEGRGS